jgi:hypothetical protein
VEGQIVAFEVTVSYQVCLPFSFSHSLSISRAEMSISYKEHTIPRSRIITHGGGRTSESQGLQKKKDEIAGV